MPLLLHFLFETTPSLSYERLPCFFQEQIILPGNGPSFIHCEVTMLSERVHIAFPLV